MLGEDCALLPLPRINIPVARLVPFSVSFPRTDGEIVSQGGEDMIILFIGHPHSIFAIDLFDILFSAGN